MTDQPVHTINVKSLGSWSAEFSEQRNEVVLTFTMDNGDLIRAGMLKSEAVRMAKELLNKAT